MNSFVRYMLLCSVLLWVINGGSVARQNPEPLAKSARRVGHPHTHHFGIDGDHFSLDGMPF
jgi:hypothetical protein